MKKLAQDVNFVSNFFEFLTEDWLIQNFEKIKSLAKQGDTFHQYLLAFHYDNALSKNEKKQLNGTRNLLQVIILLHNTS